MRLRRHDVRRVRPFRALSVRLAMQPSLRVSPRAESLLLYRHGILRQRVRVQKLFVLLSLLLLNPNFEKTVFRAAAEKGVSEETLFICALEKIPICVIV